MDAKEKKRIKEFLKSYSREESKIKQIEEDVAYINETLSQKMMDCGNMKRNER